MILKKILIKIKKMREFFPNFVWLFPSEIQPPITLHHFNDVNQSEEYYSDNGTTLFDSE